jgi:hypothetical protein
LAEARILHVKSFEFRFLFSKDVQRRLVNFSTSFLDDRGFLNGFWFGRGLWFRRRFFSRFSSRSFLNGFWFGRRFRFRCRFFSGLRFGLSRFGLNGFCFLFGGFLNWFRLRCWRSTRGA